jgi:hypothetical protein
MEQIMQQVSSSERLSLLDDFSRYNQVLMSLLDQLKTTLCTPWGTYTYRTMDISREQWTFLYMALLIS